MAGIEIRDYEGDFEDITELSREVWIPEYGGKIWVPVPDADFLRWRFSAQSGGIVKVAYQGTRLVGSVFSTPHLMRVGTTVHPIALFTGFSVVPEYRRLALPLIERLRNDNRERGVALALGMVIGDPRSASYRFWSKYAETFPQNFYLLFQGTYWGKYLAPEKLTKAGIHAWERLACRIAGPLIRYVPHGYDPNVRPYRPEDLDRCVQMLATNCADYDWALVWPPERLAPQLDNQLYRTLVSERDGKIRGMVNYHDFWLQGREPVRAAIIDLWAEDDITHAERVRLISHLCTDLIERGIHGVIAPRSTMMPRAALWSNFFVPSDEHFKMGVFPSSPAAPLAPPKTWSLEIT